MNVSRRPEPWAEVPTVDWQPTSVGADERAEGDIRVGRRLGGRFRLLRRLGVGGSGTVYEARDEQREGALVALKMLHCPSAHSVHRLKREFRALQDVAHRNLAALFELVADEDQWFYTMELVRGVHFRQYVCRGGIEPDLARLSSSLAELVHGVRALHAAGRVHRDLKPNNVLVEPGGRVVIVDFGLVLSTAPGQDESRLEGGFAGTPGYAAPEQYEGSSAVTEAADWYAVGVMLYEALCGVRPQASDPSVAPPLPRPVRELAPNTPAALADVCMELLDHEPSSRACGEDLLRVLAQARTSNPAPQVSPVAELVGREAELERLRAALARVEQGTQQAVCVSGVSGMGKSTLLAAFLSEVSQRPNTLVLHGRCQIHENVPYKAFDSVVDALCRYLNWLPAVSAASLLPRNAHLLTRIFPSMGRVAAVAAAPVGRAVVQGAHHERELATIAFKQLLTNIADHVLLVLSVDDLQWGDLDSARLLRRLLSAPEAPAMLFVGAFRSEDREQSAVLREVLVDAGRATRIEVQALAALDAGATEALVRQFALGSDESVRNIRVQSAGHPFYAVELARDLASASSGESEPVPVSLESMVARRVAALGEPARRLLRAASVAGASVSERLLQEVAEVGGLETFRELRLARMLREQVRDDGLLFTTYHDRIREVVVEALSDSERARWHLRLATCGERAASLSLEQLALHYRAAGAREQARRMALQAATHAQHAHAYFRAADMLRIAIECSDGDVGDLRERLAKTLATAGQRTAAAEEYDRIADACTDSEARFEMRAMAMRQWLLAGHPRGKELLLELGEAEGLAPRPLNALGTARDVLRGLFSARAAQDWEREAVGELTARERRQRTLCWAGMTATLLGRAEDLRYAIGYAFTLVSRFGPRLGPDLRMVAWLLVLTIWPGWWGRVGSLARTRLQQLRVSMNRREETDLPLIWAAMDAALQLQCGGFGEAVRRYESLLERSARTELGTIWLAGARMACGVIYFWTGRWEQHARLTAEWSQTARENGDAHVAQHLTITGSMRHLVADDPELAQRDFDDVVADSDNQHPLLDDSWWPATIALYRGRPEEALPRFEAARARLPARGLGERAATFHLLHLWEAMCLAECRLRGAPVSLWRIRLRLWLCYTRPLRFAPATRLHLRAMLASLRGKDPARVIRLLRRAADAWDAVELPVFADALRGRLATYLPAQDGEQVWRHSVEAFESRGAVNPARWIDTLGAGVRPGPWSPTSSARMPRQAGA